MYQTLPGDFVDIGVVGGTSCSSLMTMTHDGCAGYRPRRRKTRICRLRQGPPCLCILDGFRHKAADRIVQRLAGCSTKVWITPRWLQTKVVSLFSLNPLRTAPSLTHLQPERRQIISLHECEEVSVAHLSSVWLHDLVPCAKPCCHLAN